ncbi:MAG: hypothetical protein D6722_13095 [Bacteroidetes bacterium]|nr:MAG: hypothetical protein D6722_13095 [Bacteroidota bacterium]
MEGILLFFGTILLLILLLALRYLQVRSSLRNAKAGSVQHSSLRPPPKDTTVDFLPGSRAGAESSVEKMKTIMQEGLHVKHMDDRGRRRRHPLALTGKRDLMRSYIVDAILDKPKWRDPGQGMWE